MKRQNKKQRVSKPATLPTRSPTLYEPFRALGYVTRDIPFSLQMLGDHYFMTTALDHGFQVYNVSQYLEREREG
jgi:U3 small nucleolar RNA-associated protein 21